MLLLMRLTQKELMVKIPFIYIFKFYCHLLNNIWKSQILSRASFAPFLSKEQPQTIVTKINESFPWIKPFN